MAANYNLQKPFLKWVGGKTQIIDYIITMMPKEMNNYHEIFLGGGSVLLAVLSLQKQNKIIIRNKIYAYDNNYDLINVYKHIQNDKNELYRLINLYLLEYDNIENNIINRKPTNIEEAKTSKESYYYWLRNKYNNIEKNTIECSAIFILINKLCFRGLYREGKNGYNVPYGHYKKTPKIISEIELNNIYNLIKDVNFQHLSFTDSLKNIVEEDFLYLDPPYVPENLNSFVGYLKDGFNLKTHELLFFSLKDIIKKFNNVKFIMSNSNVKFVIDNSKEYNLKEIIAKRTINSKKPNSMITELIIYN